MYTHYINVCKPQHTAVVLPPALIFPKSLKLIIDILSALQFDAVYII